MMLKQFLPLFFLLNCLPVMYGFTQNVDFKKMEVNIRKPNIYSIDLMELEVLLRDTNVILRLMNADSTDLENRDLPPVVVRDIAFKIAGVDTVLSRHTELDELDKDFIYWYSRSGLHKKLQGKYSFMRYALSIELQKVASRIITRKAVPEK